MRCWCVSDRMSDVTALSACAVWYAVVLSLSLPHSVSSILSFSLEEGLPHHTEGLFWDLTSPSLQQPSCCSHFVCPTGTGSCGGNYTGVWGVTGDAKVTAHTGASTLTPTRLVLYIVQNNTTYLCKENRVIYCRVKDLHIKMLHNADQFIWHSRFKQMHPKHRHLHFHLYIWNNENKYSNNVNLSEDAKDSLEKLKAFQNYKMYHSK